jgi:hypothetical protein
MYWYRLQIKWDKKKRWGWPISTYCCIQCSGSYYICGVYNTRSAVIVYHYYPSIIIDACYQMQLLWQPSADAGNEPSETDRWTQQRWEVGSERQLSPPTTSWQCSPCHPWVAVLLLAEYPAHWIPEIQNALLQIFWYILVNFSARFVMLLPTNIPRA